MHRPLHSLALSSGFLFLRVRASIEDPFGLQQATIATGAAIASILPPEPRHSFFPIANYLSCFHRSGERTSPRFIK
jgi:hypothetical protein